MTQVTQTRKALPTCHGCGHYTCTDCGQGFESVEAYLQHRTDAKAHAEPRGAAEA